MKEIISKNKPTTRIDQIDNSEINRLPNSDTIRALNLNWKQTCYWFSVQVALSYLIRRFQRRLRCRMGEFKFKAPEIWHTANLANSRIVWFGTGSECLLSATGSIKKFYCLLMTF